MANLASAAERFVGRADELRRIERLWTSAPSGRGAVALVSGEAGIGKSRFCDEVVARARRAGLAVAMSRCWGGGGAPPLWPWQAILADLRGDDASEPPAADGVELSGDADRFARFTAMVEELRTVSTAAPVCVVIDDIHAADAGTLLLTRFVARSLHRAPIVVVLSRRTGEPTPDPFAARLVEEIEQEAVPVALRHFDLDEALTFLAAHGWRDISSDLGLAVLRVTGGNPLFLRRVAALGPPDPSRPLPVGLRVAIEDALAALSPATRRVLWAGAVVGPDPAVPEVAAVAEVATAAVLEAVAEAAPSGLVAEPVDSAPERFTFGHELVRSALEAGLPSGDRLDAHARAAAAVTASDAPNATTPGAGRAAPVERLARRARHALAAAPRSPADARLAVEACREAAAAMVGGFAYERADELLSTAIDMHRPATLGEPPADLVLRWAQAALLCGRLGEARTRFDRAASAAEQAGDPVLLAEAALGLGGHWLNEHRAPVERARVLGLQRRALAELPGDDGARRARLAARLAAEAVYDGAPLEPVHEALAAARATGDGPALAEALSLCHHALLAPEHARRRLRLADELIRVAAEAGCGVLALMGLCWRTVDLFLLGDPRGVRALRELRERADALACQNIVYIADVLDIMLLIREGRLDAAEAASGRAFELGSAVGEVDAVAYFGAHTLAIRWIQGRDAEILDAAEEVATSPTLVEAEFGFRATVAAVAARAGEHDRARAALERLCRHGVAALPRSSTWLAGIAALIEAAAVEGDVAVAQQAYDLLAPFADLPVMPSLAVICLGSAHRYLGLAALTTDDPDAAVRHLEQAVAANRRLGNHPLTTIATADLGAALARRGGRGDAARARRLWERAVRDADDLGMTDRAEAWRAGGAAARAPATDAVLDLTDRPADGPVADDEGLLCRQGRGWLVQVGERRAVVPALVGMTYLAELVTRPGQPVSARTLATGGDARLDLRHELIDTRARDAYAERARELAADVAAAAADNDLGRAERLRIELDAVAEQLEAATGLGGRPRAFADDHERARTSVRKAIKRAIDEVAAADPVIGEVLRAGVTTGATCMFVTAPGGGVRWTVRRAQGAGTAAGGR